MNALDGGKTPRGKPSLRGEPLSSPRMLELIAAAEQTFLAKGYHAATMSDVAKTAGMSKKTIYQLIESKEELFGVLLAQRNASLVFPQHRADATVREILIENILCVARFLLSPQQISIIRLIMAEYTHSPNLGRIFHQKGLVHARNRLECCLRETCIFKNMDSADVRELSAMLFGMALGEFHLGILVGFRAKPTKAALEQRVSKSVDIFLHQYGRLSPR